MGLFKERKGEYHGLGRVRTGTGHLLMIHGINEELKQCTPFVNLVKSVGLAEFS